MRYYLICIFLLLGFWSNKCNVFAQVDSVIFHKIDSLKNNDDFYSVAILYEKLSYLCENEDQKNFFKILSADYYKKSERFESAIQILNTIDLSEESDSIVFKTKFQLSLLNYLKNDFPSAQYHLDEMYSLVKDSTYHYLSYLLYILILNEQYQWEKAKQYCLKLNEFIYSNNEDIKYKNYKIIDSIYNPKKFPKLKNPDKAIFLSTFLPCLGQFYTKNYSEGIISFLMISSISVISVVGIINQYYYTSIIGGSALLNKFYKGGIIRSEFLAKKYNYTHSKKYNEQLKQILIENLYNFKNKKG